MLRNVVLFSSLFILVGLTLYQCYRSSYVYWQNPTFFSSSFQDQKWAKLPHITACLDPGTDQHPAFKDHTNISYQNWKEDIFAGKYEFDNITFGNDWEILDYLYIRRFQADEEDQTGFRLSDKHDEQLKNENLIIRSHPRFGKCLTLNYSAKNRALGLYYLMARHSNATYPLRYFLHAPEEFWFSTIHTSGIKVEISNVAQVQVTFEDVRMVDEDDRNCSKRSRDECLTQYLIERIRCRPPWMDLSIPLCMDPKEAKEADRVIEFALSNLTGICQIPCNFLEIRSGARNFDLHEDETKMFLYFTYKVPIL